MRPTVIIPLLLSLFLSQILFGCDNAKQQQEPTKNNASMPVKDIDVRKRIEEINQLLSKAVMANDYETQLKYFSENIVIEPPFTPAVKGKRDIQKGFEKNESEDVVFHSHNTTIEDLWVCGDRVYEKGTWGIAQSSNRSKTPKAYYGSYFAIWRLLHDDSYVIDYIIFNLDFNPYEGH